MATRKPLVRVGGRVQQLPAEDSLPPQAPAPHQHVIADISGLLAALDGKQAALGFKITVSTTAPVSPTAGDVWISY